jgi:hypothetical protein
VRIIDSRRRRIVLDLAPFYFVVVAGAGEATSDDQPVIRLGSADDMPEVGERVGKSVFCVRGEDLAAVR